MNKRKEICDNLPVVQLFQLSSLRYIALGKCNAKKRWGKPSLRPNGYLKSSKYCHSFQSNVITENDEVTSE